MSACGWSTIAAACYKISVYWVGGRSGDRGAQPAYWRDGECVEAQIPNWSDGILYREQCLASGCKRYLRSHSSASDGGRRLSIPDQEFDRSVRTGCKRKSACDALDRDPDLLHWVTIPSVVCLSLVLSPGPDFPNRALENEPAGSAALEPTCCTR